MLYTDKPKSHDPPLKPRKPSLLTEAVRVEEKVIL